MGQRMRFSSKFPLTRRQTLVGATATFAGGALLSTAQALAGSPLRVSSFRSAVDGEDWTPALRRAFAEAQRRRTSLLMPANPQPMLLRGAVQITPAADGWTPHLHGNGAFLRLGSVKAGFRYLGRKDGAHENPLAGGISNLTIDYAKLGDPEVNSGVRGIYISNGGGNLTFQSVRGVNMLFGYHIQNWRYADGGRPGGGLTTRSCDCSGAPSDNKAPKWYPFGDQGDLSVDMPGDVVAPGQIAVIATVKNQMTGYGAKQPAHPLFWTNDSAQPARIPDELTVEALSSVGLTEGPSSALLRGRQLDPVTYAYWTSGGRRSADCVVSAESGLIDGANHDGGYYGCMLSGVDGYEVRNFQTQNNVRGFVGQHGARNVKLEAIRVSRSQSSAILAGYSSPNWTIDNLHIEASNDRWIGEALLNIQLGCEGTTIKRGTIRMGDNQKTGQYAVKIGPNSPRCRIEGPLVISGDCAKAYVAVESAWDNSLSKRNPENYAQLDYRGIASRSMDEVVLRNITIAANSINQNVPTAIAIIEGNDGAASAGGHGDIPVLNLLIENVEILSSKHIVDLKLIGARGENARLDCAETVSVRGLQTWDGEIVRPTKAEHPPRCNPFSFY